MIDTHCSDSPWAGLCHRPAAAAQARGFTLIELVVALFISAVMFAIGYAELDQALRSRRELEEQSARLIAVQQAMRIMEQDFELLQPRPVRNILGDGYLPAVTTSPTGGLEGLAPAVGSSPSGSSGALIPLVTFTRGSWTNPTGVQRGELQRVSYAIQNGLLMREYSPVLDATLQDSIVSRMLIDHVKSFSLRFMDAGHNWQTQWPAATIGAAPAAGAGGTTTAPSLAQLPQLRIRPVAVEVTLELDDWGVLVREFEVAG